MSAEHSIPLVVMAGAMAGLLVAARRWSQGWVDAGASAIAVAVVLTEAVWWVITATEGRMNLRWGLPLHLCGAGCFVLAFALLWRNHLAAEISYFWSIGGTLPGLFTPDIPGKFPEAVFFQYYLEHGLLVLGALYLVIVLKMRPAPGAVRRVLLWTAGYAVVVGVVDYLTGGNYLFLRNVPPSGTLFDYMGPWPWYIVTLTVLAVIIFNLLYLPFARRPHPAAAMESPSVPRLHQAKP
jgi:hypothetical integral membrane protein (TIGR02206 family)